MVPTLLSPEAQTLVSRSQTSRTVSETYFVSLSGAGAGAYP
jgi:hypothetical protein